MCVRVWQVLPPQEADVGLGQVVGVHTCSFSSFFCRSDAIQTIFISCRSFKKPSFARSLLNRKQRRWRKRLDGSADAPRPQAASPGRRSCAASRAPPSTGHLARRGREKDSGGRKGAGTVRRPRRGAGRGGMLPPARQPAPAPACGRHCLWWSWAPSSGDGGCRLPVAPVPTRPVACAHSCALSVRRAPGRTWGLAPVSHIYYFERDH